MGIRKTLLARILVWMGFLADSTDSPKIEYFSQAVSIWSRWAEKSLPEPKDEDKHEMTEITKILSPSPQPAQTNLRSDERLFRTQVSFITPSSDPASPPQTTNPSHPISRHDNPPARQSSATVHQPRLHRQSRPAFRPSPPNHERFLTLDINPPNLASQLCRILRHPRLPRKSKNTDGPRSPDVYPCPHPWQTSRFAGKGRESLGSWSSGVYPLPNRFRGG